MTKGCPHRYSAEELAWIQERCAWPRDMLHSTFVLLFDRREINRDAIKALCQRKRWKTGRTGRIEAGSKPWNTGLTGWSPPGSIATRFKKGGRSGRAQALYRPIGTERCSKDGYLERKINDDLPLQARWRAVHLIRWEAIHGPVPEGHCLKSLDGSRTNTDPDNWISIPRALLPRLVGGPHGRKLAYNDAEPEVRPALLAAAQVEHQARTLGKAQAA